MNPFVERVIGSIRRECTDHIIAMGEQHLTQILREYAAYHNSARCHQALAGYAPEPRARETTPLEDVIAVPVLGGLHHEYRRAA
jgi:putative transposase